MTSSENPDGSYRHLDNDHHVVGTTIFTPIQVKTQLEVDNIFFSGTYNDLLDNDNSESHNYDLEDNDYSTVIYNHSCYCGANNNVCLYEDDDEDYDFSREDEDDEDDIDYNDYVDLDCCCVDESEPSCDHDEYDDCTDFDDF